MTTRDPSLDPAALDRRLHERIGDERNGQVDFLLDLDLFDRREDFLPAGFGSLWDYCRRSLHLREGATHRRITAMRLLRRFPGLEAPLRDGRLCLSTVSALREVLTEENVGQLVTKAAYLSKAETEHLVATLRPRTAPREGIRKLPEPVARRELELVVQAGAVEPGRTSSTAALPVRPERSQAAQPPSEVEARARSKGATFAATSTATPAPRPARPELEPVSADVWSLRVNIDAGLKGEIEALKALLSHKLPAGDLVSVLREAVACAIEKHGKRRGAVRPKRARARAAGGKPSVTVPTPTPASAPRTDSREAIPAEVRRQVWERDGGRCTFVGPDGVRCGSRYKVELHHRHPAALGGPPTPANLTVHCQPHNRLEAERDFGRAHMARFRRRTLETTLTGGNTSSRRSDQG